MTETVVAPQLDAGSQKIITNYWGVSETSRYELPDGFQWFEFKLMNEGDKTKFQKSTNQDITLNRDQSAKMRMDPASERHALIKASVVDWNLYAPDEKTGEMGYAKFSPAILEKWLMVAPPKVVEDLEFAIRQANPWLQADMSLEDIDKELDRLQEMRRAKVDSDAEKEGSANK